MPTRQALKDVGFISTMVGGFLAFMLGIAAINAHDGQAWAIGLMQNVIYLLSMCIGLGICAALAIGSAIILLFTER